MPATVIRRLAPGNSSSGSSGREAKHRREELFSLMDQGLLDTEEQQELIEVMREEAQRTSSTQRMLMGTVGVATALFFAASSAYQVARPWDTRFTAEFRNTWSAPMVATALMVTAAPSALAAMALLRFQPPCAHSRQTYSREALNSHRTIMHASLSLAVLSSAYWGLSLCWEYYQVLQSARFPGLVRFPYRLLWLPATPLVAALLSKHVVDTSNDVLKSVGDLKAKIYDYKRL
eukprot:CAMPEP_0117686008 /NCGR_PEP_ID=MMETSP0804-20121206/22152_1 /TAXON_ID=1074897 /ORGANISM="Tetraselmis astigmatica, Strain CCMP880" /LENGTH=232 /DNA_ID=CAMNT_0005497535 /DNA_START=31 /DNA_END=729 /DNA_ORIENTATION=-